MSLTDTDIQNALKTLINPDTGTDFVTARTVKRVQVSGNDVSVDIELGYPAATRVDALRQAVLDHLKALPGIGNVSVSVVSKIVSHAVQKGVKLIPGVKNIIAVASGKGGVGKSTVSVNLACGLRHLGARVGLLDCDIYGPSIPLMMGINERPGLSEEEKMIPPTSHGVKLMSMGFLLNDDQPVIWRGPMIQRTIQQFITVVDWGELDFLLVDLPPGTGDAQLTLCQTVPLDGGVIVTTPQEASLGVVRKGIAMFEKVNVPLLGIVENMSYFTTPNGERVEIFGHGGGRQEAERIKIPFLGEIPIYTAIREGGDRGMPVVVSAPDQPAGCAFLQVVEALRARFK